jgi:hypothetical protein
MAYLLLVSAAGLLFLATIVMTIRAAMRGEDEDEGEDEIIQPKKPQEESWTLDSAVEVPSGNEPEDTKY